MNAQLSMNNENISNQFDSNELRDLSCAEQTQVSGGRACYRNNGGRNADRYSVRNGFISYEKYSNSQRRYVIIKTFDLGGSGTGTPFTDFCKANGYPHIR
jgi:hypothetical protein